MAEGLGVDRQEKDLRKLAAERGYEVVNVYVDNDVSASDPSVTRPSYERMLADVAAGSIDVVLAWDDDRLVRQPKELERFFEVLDAAGAMYATTSTTVDVATGEGMLIARIKGAVAAEEVRKLSKRSQRKHQELAERGLPAGGGYRCFGYSCKRAKRIALGEVECDVPGCKHDGITVVEHEAQIIREVAGRYLGGEGLRAIARDLNSRGVTTSTGREWIDTTLLNLLTNPRLAGLRARKGEVVGPAVWDAIIDLTTHERIVSFSRSRKTPGPKNPRTHVLARLVKCSKCDSTMHATPVFGRFSYRCHQKPGTNHCNGMAIKAEPVDQAVEAMVLYRLSSPIVADVVNGRPTAAQSNEAELLDEIAGYESRLADAAGMYAEGMITSAQLRVISAKLKKQVDAARSKLAVGERGARLSNVTANAADLVERWDGMTTEAKHAVIASLVDRVEILPGVRGSHHVDVESRVRVHWIA